jgi:hypothetical protein
MRRGNDLTKALRYRQHTTNPGIADDCLLMSVSQHPQPLFESGLFFLRYTMEASVQACSHKLLHGMGSVPEEIKIAWSTKAQDAATVVETRGTPEGAQNGGLIQSVVRAHVWMQSLRNGTYESVESLADAIRLHPKVIRQALRLAFLSPAVTSAILEGRQPAGLSLARIPKLLPLRWTDHLQLLADS